MRKSILNSTYPSRKGINDQVTVWTRSDPNTHIQAPITTAHWVIVNLKWLEVTRGLLEADSCHPVGLKSPQGDMNRLEVALG
ncbi:hypothetical protein DPMN_024521 [Dreissena polymorpha]|uniref:Uncharacterized protein n=1 Tax=Dreissena polymorpha TaxID=45954 RepID=A0A9D4LPX8_DREPO|nr:hypothetical protein DPMN_024521 [Dreissena polymorpha]